MNGNNTTSIELEIGKRVVIGRDEHCDLVDDHCYVSRKHAALELLEDGRVRLTDLDSSNGTSWRTGIEPFKRLDTGKSETIPTDADICLGGVESRYYRLVGKKLIRGGGLEIRFDNVSIRSSKKLLFDDHASTVIQRGSFAVIIGTSGGGKSLLMNAVSDTLGSGYRYEGISLAPEMKSKGIRFVPQDDAVPLELTVEQVMQAAAELRLSKEPLEKRCDIINRVLDQVGLLHSRGVRISKLSGGQRKRVSVAVDLLDYPQLLILDEPTSGLDAGTEQSLLELLKNISRQEGITVVCITHSTAACELADDIVVVGKKAGADVSCICFSGNRTEILAAAGVQEIKDIYPLIADPPKDGDSKTTGRKGPFSQWNTVFRRSWAKLRADTATFRLTFALPLLLGILVGLSQRNHNESLSPYFFLVLSALWVGMSLTIRELIVERRIYVRDKIAGLRPTAYLSGKLAYAASVSFLQVFLLYVPACVCLVAWNINLNEMEGKYVASALNGTFGPTAGCVHIVSLLVLFGVLFGGNMLGLIGSILARSEQTAVLLQIFFLLPQILVSRVAYSFSYYVPGSWHSGPFELIRYWLEPLESWLQRIMDAVSLIFVSRFGVSVMEVTAIRDKYVDDSFCGDITVEAFAFVGILLCYAIVLFFLFQHRESRWGLR